MSDLSIKQRRDKLRKLAKIEGFENVPALLEASARDSVSPAICCNPDKWDCNYTEELEPDQRGGWCDECQANTMKSALVIAGVI